MHELSVCRALIREAEAVARRHRARGVSGVCLRVGPLCGIEAALLRSAFPVASAGTCLEGAALTVDQTSLRVTCDACGAHSSARPNRLTCAACGDWRTRLVSGDELTLVSVELLFDAPADTVEANRV